MLHHELAVDEVSKQRPFAGKQIILVGEFLQLKPVSSMFDEGNFMFLSPLFTLAIPHRFELTQVMRQSDPEFLFAISEIRMGKCSERTEQFLSFLQRDLQEDMERVATHIFFRKVNAHLFNMQKVSELEGELLSFNAEYQNDQSRSMSWPGQHRLQLKVKSKVLLVWNKSDNLRNGTFGTFVGIRGERLLACIFPRCWSR